MTTPRSSVSVFITAILGLLTLIWFRNLAHIHATAHAWMPWYSRHNERKDTGAKTRAKQREQIRASSVSPQPSGDSIHTNRLASSLECSSVQPQRVSGRRTNMPMALDTSTRMHMPDSSTAWVSVSGVSRSAHAGSCVASPEHADHNAWITCSGSSLASAAAAAKYAPSVEPWPREPRASHHSLADPMSSLRSLKL